MKTLTTILLATLLVFGANSLLFADVQQNPPPTNENTTPQNVQTINLPSTPNVNQSPVKNEKDCECQKNELDWFQKVIVLMPVILSLLIFLFVMKALRGNYSLSEALSDSDFMPNTQTTANPTTGQTTTTTSNIAVPSKSSSRLILFISGLISVILTVCITSYYFYYYFNCGQSPDLSALLSVLLSLGIGVVPYSVNKVMS